MKAQAQPGFARPETLDIEDPASLGAYLISVTSIAQREDFSTRILPGGVSSRTVLVVFRSGRRMVLKQSLAKLRVAADWFSAPERIHREALGMRCLGKLAPPGAIPSLLFEDRAAHVIAMSAVPDPNRTWKEMLLTEAPEVEHFHQFAHILSRIHSQSSGDESLGSIFADRSYFESLRLEPYYRRTLQQVPESSPFLAGLIEDTLARRLALVHGDYSPKNILAHDGKFVLVDHEVIHFGDPAFDVGFSLTHLLAKALHRRQFREGILAGAAAFLDRYLEGVQTAHFDEDFECRCCRHTAACLLARVAGRSPLEYLTAEERRIQKEIALDLMDGPALTFSELIARFTQALHA